MAVHDEGKQKDLKRVKQGDQQLSLLYINLTNVKSNKEVNKHYTFDQR